MALLECKKHEDLSDKVPLGVKILSYKVKLKTEGEYICLARLEVPKYSVKRSKACGVDYEEGLLVDETLGLSKTEINAIEGSFGAECYTCDDLAVESFSGVQDKFYCLMGNYLNLNSKAAQPLSGDEELMKQEIVEVLNLFKNDYQFILTTEQLEGIDLVLSNE